MTQYDDFGRPIYETAEEYNKAHKKGVCPRTYDSPTGANYQRSTRKGAQQTSTATQRFSNQERSKKAKSLVIGTIAVLLVLNIIITTILVGSFGVSFDSDYDVNEENWFDAMIDVDESGTEEYLSDASTPLPTGFETFTYNGKTYTLPGSYEDLIDEGIMEEGGFFYIDNPLVYDYDATVPDFVFGDGLTFESSYEEVEAYLGTPYYHYEDHSDIDFIYDSYEWSYYGEEESHYINIVFVNGVMSDVMIDKTVY